VQAGENGERRPNQHQQPVAGRPTDEARDHRAFSSIAGVDNP
jgi:hypothetical protein